MTNINSIKHTSLAHFEVFLIVAETLNFSQAARILGVTRASVSQSIKNLEQSLGVSLFVRTTRSISLSGEGELLLSQCRRLKYELDNTRLLVENFHKKPKGVLTISSNPFLAEHKLFPILRKYRAKFPEVDFNVVLEERVVDFDRDRVDIVFGINWPAPDDVIARKIGNTRYVMYASPEYIKNNGMPQNIDDLKNHNFILHSGRDAKLVGIKEKIDTSFIKSNFASNKIRYVKKAALEGMGIAQSHDYIVKKELQEGSLVEILPEIFNSKESLYIYYQKNNFVQPKVKELVKIILESKII